MVIDMRNRVKNMDTCISSIFLLDIKQTTSRVPDHRTCCYSFSLPLSFLSSSWLEKHVSTFKREKKMENVRKGEVKEKRKGEKAKSKCGGDAVWTLWLSSFVVSVTFALLCTLIS
jgi:hypothetical protein